MRFGLISLMLCVPSFCAEVYRNDFNTALGTTYPEWTSSGYTNSANQAGTIAAGSGPQSVATATSPNGRQQFLGEFGGPVVVAAPPYDPQHFVRVDELLITHKLHRQEEPEFDIREPRQSAPHDCVAWWRVLRPVEIASQSSDLD